MSENCEYCGGEENSPKTAVEKCECCGAEQEPSELQQRAAALQMRYKQAHERREEANERWRITSEEILEDCYTGKIKPPKRLMRYLWQRRCPECQGKLSKERREFRPGVIQSYYLDRFTCRKCNYKFVTGRETSFDWLGY